MGVKVQFFTSFRYVLKISLILPFIFADSFTKVLVTSDVLYYSMLA